MSRFLNIAVFATVATLSVNAYSEDAMQSITMSTNEMAAKMAENNNNMMSTVANNNNIMAAITASNNSIMAAMAENNRKLQQINGVNDISNNVVSLNNNAKNTKGSIYLKVFASLMVPSLMEENFESYVFNMFPISKDIISSFSVSGKQINGVKFALGLKRNLGSGTLFIAPEIFGTYMFKNTTFSTKYNESNFLGYHTHDDGPRTERVLNYEIKEYNKNIKIHGIFGTSVKFGVNLFNELISVYVKPNFGFAIVDKNVTINHSYIENRAMYHNNIMQGESYDGYSTTTLESSKEKQFNIVAGGGVGIEFNVLKHLLLSAELNYDFMPYKITVDAVGGGYVKGVYKMLTFNFGAGFKF